MSDNSRLFEARKFLGLTQKQFSDYMMIGQNTLSMIENGRINLTDRHRSVLAERLRINPLWLDTGIGEMFLDPSITRPRKATNVTPSQRGVPFYNKPFTGSTNVTFDTLAREDPEFYIDYEPFNDCSFYRTVYGDSMCPRYNPGDVVACKKVLNKNIIMYGESYFCLVRMDGDSHETIKVLRRNPDPTMIILKPLNPDFDESIVPIDSIIDLYIIKGKIERNI